MAVREELILDLSQALSQIDQLERELDGLFQPIVIPVDVETDASLSQLQSQIRAVDNDDIDVDVDVDGISRAEDEMDDLTREVRRAEDAFEDLERDADDTSDAVLRVGTRGVSAFSNLRGSLLGVGAAFATFQVGGALFDFFGEAIGAASDLEESTSKAQVVFGDFFDDIQQFASTAPSALGLANAEALEFTGTFGNLFTALGLSQDAAADLAPEIVQLGADLASFNNLEVTDALEKLRAGLVGEAEPLRALGVNLTAATTEAKALELGLADSTGAIDDAAKVQARYALILEQTTNAQGDFARTSDSIANRQRTIAGEFEKVRAELGEALLPAFEALLDVAPELIETIRTLGPAFGSLGAQIAGAVEQSGGFVTFLSDLPRGFGAVTDVVSGLGSTVTTPIEALFSLFQEGTDPLDEFVEQYRALGEISDNIEIRVIEQDVIDALRDGVEPVDAFANALLRLDEGSTLDASSIRRFLTITGVAAEDAEDVLRAFVNARDNLVLSDQEFDDLAAALDNLIEIPADPFEGLDEGIAVYERFLTATAGTAGELNATRNALDGFFDVDIGGQQLDSQISDTDGLFAQLPDSLGAARDALRDEEGEIIDDFGTFFDNLEEELEARAQFSQNLLTLRALGFDDLADQFAALGLDSAQALADGLANPEELANAEAALERFETSIDQAYAQAIAEAVAEGTSSIAELVTAIESVDGLSSVAQIQVLFEAIGAIDSREVFEGNITAPASTPQTQGGGDTDITVNVEASGDPAVDGARIGQTVASIVNNVS